MGVVIIDMEQKEYNNVNLIDSIYNDTYFPIIGYKNKINKKNKKDKNQSAYDIVIDKVSYNFDRQESILTYSNPNNWDNTNLYNNVGDWFNNIALDNKINSFWKWFVILALLFLLIELVILKFYK